MSDRIDIEYIREIIRLAEESGLAELEVEGPSLKVRVRRAVAGGPASAAPATPSLAGAATGSASGVSAGAVEAASLNHLTPIVAPMVGTFYRSPSPDAPPFVNEGDLVDEGQVICMIEAMKLFNEIQADKRGRVSRILVENASPVEYGQPLFLLDTSAPS